MRVLPSPVSSKAIIANPCSEKPQETIEKFEEAATEGECTEYANKQLMSTESIKAEYIHCT